MDVVPEIHSRIGPCRVQTLVNRESLLSVFVTCVSLLRLNTIFVLMEVFREQSQVVTCLTLFVWSKIYVDTCFTTESTISNSNNGYFS